MPFPLNLSLNELAKILDIHGSPLYIYDHDSIKQNAKYFMNTFKKYIPDFEQYYAVKALPNLQILKILKKENMGFDCSSITELKMVESIGGKILYSSNYTSVEDLKIAASVDNIIINLDDIDGFYNLLKSGSKLPKVLCFRLNPGFGKTDSGSTSNVLGGSESKFGMSLLRIIDAYKIAKNNGINKFGIHVMTGSCVMNVDYWKELIDVVFENMCEINKSIGIEFEFIDLGGGIGIPYRPNEEPINLETLAKTISEQIAHNVEKYNIKYPKIIMENGRYITGPYGWLLSTCKSIKSNNNTIYYGLDASITHLLRAGIYDSSYHHITIPRLESTDKADLKYANVVGPLCENNDFLGRDRLLPKGIKKEDIFIIHDAGAHATSMSNNYNGILKCAEILFKKENSKLYTKIIKKRETIDYYLQNQIIN